MNTIRSNGSTERDPSIIINGNEDWAILAVNESWCYGSGNTTDPYVIDNIEIDIKKEWANCMEIRNTNVSFIIKNCRFLQTSCCYPYDCFCGIRYGIKLENVSNGFFISNRFILHDYGIHANNCSYMTITNNEFIQSYYGIIMYDCYNNSIIGNYFNNKITGSSYAYGLGINEKTNNFNNTFSNNSIFFAGIQISINSNYMDHSNLVDGKPIYIYRNASNLIPENFSNAGYINLENCTNVHIDNISIKHTFMGLYIIDCINVTLTNILVEWNSYTKILNSVNVSFIDSEFMYSSLSIYNSNCNKITYNNLYSSGIYLNSSDYNEISFNLINWTYRAVYLDQSSDYNIIANNTIFYEETCFYNSSDCVGNQWINNTCIQI